MIKFTEFEEKLVGVASIAGEVMMIVNGLTSLKETLSDATHLGDTEKMAGELMEKIEKDIEVYSHIAKVGFDAFSNLCEQEGVDPFETSKKMEQKIYADMTEYRIDTDGG